MNISPVGMYNSAQYRSCNIKPCALQTNSVSFGKVEEYAKEEAKILKRQIRTLDVNDKNYSKRVFDILGINYKTKRGKLVIDEYKQPRGYEYSDIGINENRLLEDVIEIKGSADFHGNKHVTSLAELEHVGGYLDLYNSSVERIDNPFLVVDGDMCLPKGIKYINGVKVKGKISTATISSKKPSRKS